MRTALAILALGIGVSANAGPFLELGLGGFVHNKWPDSAGCDCNQYIGNDGLLGMVRAGVETRPYNLFKGVDVKVQASLIHVSDTGTDPERTLNAAFIGVRFE